VDTLHGWLALGKIFRILFSGEDPRTVYYGVVDDGGGFMRGKALDIPSTIAAGPSGSDTWGWDTDGSYNDWYGGHEIGHTRNRFHAEFCGAGGGAAYPYTSGRISPATSGNTAIYGFDITTRAIYGPTWKDVMTYCSNQWVSDFTYEGIRSYLVGVGEQTEALEMVTADDFLAVMGMASLTSNTANLESVYQVTQSATVPLPDPGDWTIALVDAADSDLATFSFQPDELTDGEESPTRPAVIAELVPWSAGTVKVEIRYQGQVKDSRSVSANAPTVTMDTPTAGHLLADGPFTASWSGSDADGDPLTYSLLYSNDGGPNWETLATGLAEQQLELNTDNLPGGSGMLRVLVSDGLLSGEDTSGAFSVPLHAPTAQILLPMDEQVFYPTQQIALQGDAYDLEDGMPDDTAYAWDSSIDGFLGNGAALNTSILTVTDSDAMTGEVQVSITVAEEDAPEASNLESAPNLVYAVAGFNGPTQPYSTTLRSSSETELDWTASESIPWLSLVSNTGTTPSELMLTVDPAGLGVGLHMGVITLSSPQAANSPFELPVTLQITGHAVYMPIIPEDQQNP
jgi:hypothetical protein